MTSETSVDPMDALERQVTIVQNRLSERLRLLANRGKRVQRLVRTAEHTAREGVAVLGVLGALGALHLLTRSSVRAEEPSSFGWSALRVAGAVLFAGVAGLVVTCEVLRESGRD